MSKHTLTAVRLAIAAAVLVAGAASAQSATANASATVVTPISIAKNTDMAFAQVGSTSSPGTIVLAPNGTATATGGAQVGNSGGSRAAADFTVSGTANATYAITLPASGVTLSDGSGHTMTLDTFTSSPSGTGTLSGSGSQDLKVGATLNVGGSQATGTYSGSFDVTVAYN